MTRQPLAPGIQIARLLALAGAETALKAPKDRLPFEDGGPTAHTECWREIEARMREHESSGDQALARLRHGFALSPAEYWLVMLCGAAERYPEAAVALGILMDQPHAFAVTPLAFAQLMQAARGISVEEALCAALGGGTPARLSLVELGENTPSRPSSHQTLRLAPAEVRVLLGQSDPEKQFEPPEAGRGAAAPAFDQKPLRIAARMLDECRLVCLRGPSPRALRQFAIDLGIFLELEPRWFTGSEGALPLPAMVRLREALPVLDLTGLAQLSPTMRGSLAEARNVLRRAVVLAGDSFADEEIRSMTIPRLGWREAERIWLAATGDPAMARRLSNRFQVNFQEAAAACRHASLVASTQGNSASEERERFIAQHVLEEGARRMGRLVTHLRSAARISDLVAPDAVHAQLRDIVDWQRCSGRVFGEMGLGNRTPLGRGLTCLFSGPPGTGKTFAAQCLANELGLNLYRIDLSQVVSKYIGETEKALGTVFEEAEAGHGVLLFDEADALFGKRSEVKDAHDRYANIEVGYLLQRIEAFDGVAILATNLRSNMDPAFIRRIRFVLDFPMPDAPMRRELWEQSLPSSDYIAPEVDLEIFATRFRLSGGSIQNISLAAAHMAAATPEGRITIPHLVRATYRELEKSGQSTDPVNFGVLAEHLPEEIT